MPLFRGIPKEKYRKIENHYSPLVRKADREYIASKGSSEEKEKYSEYCLILSEHDRARDKLYKESEAAELAYFADHIEELYSEIQSYVKSNVRQIRLGQSLHNKWVEKMYPDEETVAYIIFRELTPHLDLLKDKAPEKHKAITQYIEKILKETRPQPKETVKITPKQVTKGVAPTDKVSQSLFDLDKNSVFYERDKEAVDVIVGRKKGKDITTAVSIDFSKLKGVQFSDNYMLNPFAQAVHNAMLSMYCAGNKGGSIAQLYRVMFGNKGTLHAPVKESLEELKEAVEKLRHTDVTIAITDEATLYPFKRAVIKNYVMPVKMVQVELNGEKADGFVFLDKPPLYEYASQKNQVNTFDIQNLNVPLNAGKDTAVLLDYLNERLAGIKNKKSKMSDVILYDTLYSLLQLDAPTEGARRKKEYDVRKKVKAILDSWQKEGIISGYEEELEKPSNRIRSIKILP